MKPMTLLFTLCATACLTLAADPFDHHEDFHYSYPQSPGGHFSIENYNGSIEITGWDQNTVDISGTKFASSEERLRAIRIEASSSGNSVQVRTIRPEPNWHGNSGARYIIRVPRATMLDRVHSSNGALRIVDIDGEVMARTSNGGIHLSGIRGRVDADSSNGRVEADRLEGGMSFHTSNGPVVAQDVRGGLHATTSNGGIHVRWRGGPVNDRIEASTSNGPVELEFDTPSSGEIMASTSNGGITLRLPTATNANVNAHTSGHNHIYSDFGVIVRGELSKSRLEGAIGSGGPRIDLHTSNGAIRLVKI